MHDHGSIGLFLGNGLFFLVGNFGFECFCLFLFCFCLVRGEKVASAQHLGWQSKGEDHFRSWFSCFFFSLFGDNSVLFRYLSGLKTFLHVSFVFFRSLIENFSFFLFFCFLPLFDWEFSFCFVSSPFLGLGILSSFFCVFSLSWIGNFPSLCVFFRG